MEFPDICPVFLELMGKCIFQTCFADRRSADKETEAGSKALHNSVTIAFRNEPRQFIAFMDKKRDSHWHSCHFHKKGDLLFARR